MRYWISGVCLGICLAFGPVMAGNTWTDQGKALLNTMGGKTAGSGQTLPVQEIAAGLKQALEKGTQAVVSRLGAENGYYADTRVRIPLPQNLSTVKSLLDKAGFGAYTQDLELKLNRAAEAAVPKAKALFLDAISQMRIQDAKAILEGPQDAATTYFRDKMSAGLIREMTPVIDQTLSSVGAVKSYDQMMGQYQRLPFVPDVKGNLTAYTAGKAVDGVFHYLAQEEKAIRSTPAKQTTELLKKVFN